MFPAPLFTDCVTKEVHGLLIHEFRLARWRPGRHQTGKGVHDQPKVLFTRSERFFGSLSVVDIGEQDVPAADKIFHVPHAKSAYLEPAVHAIGPPTTMFNVVGTSGLNGMRKRGDHAR